MFVPISERTADPTNRKINGRENGHCQADLPEIGLSPEENVRKEVYEETGLTVESTQLQAVLIRINKKDIPQLFQYYSLFLPCTIHDEDAKFIENNETSDMGFLV